jgi:hypothetical protein
MTTGAHPILPLDIQEATWLVEFPGRILSTAELIGFRAKALAKHRQHIEEMRSRVDKRKREWLLRYEKENQHTIETFHVSSPPCPCCYSWFILLLLLSNVQIT